jgi:putative phage-type endonuclease
MKTHRIIFYHKIEDNSNHLNNFTLIITMSTSTENTQHFPFMDNLSESDIMDTEEDILETIHEYYETEFIRYCSTDFTKNLVVSISEPLFDEWVNYGLCTDTEEDYIEIEAFVNTQLEKYVTEFRYGIPPRQTSFSNCEPQNKNTITQKIKRLLSITQNEQRTTEWQEQRHNMLTASNIYKLLGSEAQYNSLIYEKCKPIVEYSNTHYVNTESTLHWGVKYEPITKMIYESMYGAKISEFGCIPHPQHAFIGASPDGIITDSTHPRYGHMIEIKNIVNREIDGIPKEEYWVQMQIQMENCDLEYCDFVETRIKEYDTKEAAFDDSEPREYKGVILYFIRKMMVANSEEIYDGSPFYVYMSFDISYTTEGVEQWTRDMKNQYNEDFVLFKTIYWYLDEISCVLVPRNKYWFECALPIFKKAWETIQEERISGYEHRCPNKKKKIVIDTSGEVHVIQNMPLSSGICLIKMDS